MKLILFKVLFHFIPNLNNWLKNVKDPRNENSIKYDVHILLWVLLIAFITKVGSRREINFKMKREEIEKNLSVLCKKEIEKIPDEDTLAYLYELLEPNELQKIIVKIMKLLIRKKVFVNQRLLGYYLIGVDGTGYLKFNKRHCAYCLKRQFGGNIYYMHYVDEFKLITSSGFSLSVGTEFVENLGKKYDKQDCELNGFYRYSEKLKKDFPQMRICLLLDGLFANKNVIITCERNHWKYIIVLKEGSIPTVYKEFETLKKLDPNNKKESEDEKVKQAFSWVNNIDYEGHLLNVLKCKEYNKKKNKETTFIWMTNFKINKSNCHIIANNGGRLRWKIENEGFKSQKCGGYNMEHAYSKHNVGMKNFYFTIQIAHIINQLIEKSSLISADLKKQIGSIKDIAYLLLEELRNSIYDLEEIKFFKTHKFQIRLDGL